MTLVSTIISDAFRQSNLLALGTSPTADQQTEALRYLNRLVRSVMGYEVGDPLTAFPIGQVGIVRPSNFPAYNTTPTVEWFVPKNTRVVLNLDTSIDLYLHPMPNDGTRVAINDIAGSLATYPVTIHGNGRMIQGATEVILSTAGLDQEWMFRADTGDWVVAAPLVTTDAIPFPEEFDDYFITMLAMRLNPSYGVQMDPQAQQTLRRAQTQLTARYKQIVPVGPEIGVTRLSLNTRKWWENQPFYGDIRQGRFPW